MALSKTGGLYRPEFEHDACGVGVVANIKGIASHDIVEKAVEVLANLGHRGAPGADPETGDGAGILIQIPHDFFVNECQKLGFSLPNPGGYGVGMVFFPQDSSTREYIKNVFERIIADEGQTVIGWRDVPVDSSSIGYAARDCQPSISQVFIMKNGSIKEDDVFERKLYVIRRVIENEIAASDIDFKDDFYIASLSGNRIVYKGLLLAYQIQSFYNDLSNENLVSGFAIVHSRFSTNTLGSWKLAHPYRMVVHNGEINTVRGNENWMHARQSMFSSSLFGDDMNKLTPIIKPGQSDTAAFDNAIELLLHTGRSLPHSALMLIPEAWGDHISMPDYKRDFYQYHSCLMEPWDGPAMIVCTDGNSLVAILDRNGLRPFRYLVTKDDLLVMGSETGVLDVPPEDVLYRSRLQPGRMFYVDFSEGRIVGDDEIKKELSERMPYGEWLSNNVLELKDVIAESKAIEDDFESVIERQIAFGYTQEDLRMILSPIMETGTEPTGSMGNDTPLAVLSDKPQLVFNYFKQLFAQVTNPPLDAIREELVTSVETFVGSEQNLFEETPEHCHQLRLENPILTNDDVNKIKSLNGSIKSEVISILYSSDSGPGSLSLALDNLCDQAVEAINRGANILVLSDRGVGSKFMAIPSLLATSALHHHLIRQGSRTKVGLVIESGEPREVHHFALLIGFGAAAVNPYLAFETISFMNQDAEYESLDISQKAMDNFVKAITKGVVKTMSKMGISTVQSYRGAQIFEAIGINESVIDKYFTWTPSRIGGVGIEEIEEEISRRHKLAYPERTLPYVDLPDGGFYQWRRDGEYHMFNPDTIAKLQYSTKTGSYETFKEFSSLANLESEELCTIRGLLDFKKLVTPIDISEVEPASEIVKRFATGAISLGSISREAHETMAIAMNRINARSNTGEGGEDFRRFTPDQNGDMRNSAVKQVASGRFGVTANYLVNSTDLQIKMAQGAKPGEGGQLPGHKVDDYIGWIRHTTPGIELISPPPHHDIYSIEDLAQLIHDLKNVNPEARIHVKLVSEVGVGTIAAGVSKGHGDVVLISGDSGGTGASPESSIKHAGLPWELGLAETHQVLVQNDLRGRIVVQTDGQIKTGRDVAIACLLGAEEFGMATAPLVVMGCIMLRKCHLNTCSVGIATQDPELRKKFSGQPEHVINYFFFVAEELREIMAEIGFRKVEDMIGRMDMLEPIRVVEHWKAKNLDLSPLLKMPVVERSVATFCCVSQDHGLENALDHKLIECADSVLSGISKEPVTIEMPINNGNRTVGAMLSGRLVKEFGEEGLPKGTINIKFTGSGGQSLGAFLAKGISMEIEGDANDYLGKGICGGQIALYPDKKSIFESEENIIAGNVIFYGATDGKGFIRGLVGERFCVRNSGAHAVVEGIGDHGCEYMTGGRVVILGKTGRNFAAGMSGGIAYVYDVDGEFQSRCNMGMIELGPVNEKEDVKTLRSLIEEHITLTDSKLGKEIIENWDEKLKNFVRVLPIAYKQILHEERSGTQENSGV
tara:strand:+ start:9892 stop:14421 length:4530 start_codon:yes stop_codon:yes gene_type:complete